MNKLKHSYILYLILAVITCTISIQYYWNYKNYQTHKKQLINEVQICLDNAVENYYEGLVEKFIFRKKEEFHKPAYNINIFKEHFEETNEFESHAFILESIRHDSIINGVPFNSEYIEFCDNSFREVDSLHIIPSNLKNLTEKVAFTLSFDSLDLQQLDILINKELERKQINVDHGLTFISKKTNDTINVSVINKSQFKTTADDNLFPNRGSLTIYFNDGDFIIAKRTFTGLFISTILILCVIACLFFLLKIIKNQKQLAEIKNDLISNITHEFKTPISTISVALESLNSFNAIENKAKTKTYLDMSINQLSKLNTMVEKLLETATLDSEELQLNKEHYNLSEIINTIINKHQFQDNTKQITSTITKNLFISLDAFHFENAINNLIDNAIKYGGNKISVNLKANKNDIIITIEDSGASITKSEKNKIFEKFYRIQKGNTHDVKGFGIGLYYTKQIIEKHNGTLALKLKAKSTQFKIQIPNA